MKVSQWNVSDGRVSIRQSVATMIISRIRSLRPRISLRWLLLCLTVLCCGLGWTIHVVHQRKVLRDWLEWNDIDCFSRPRAFAEFPAWQRWLGVAWLRSALGDTHVVLVRLPDDLPSSEKSRIRGTFSEAIIKPTWVISPWSRASAAEYGKRQREQTREEAYLEDLQRLFMAERQPSLDALQAIAPRILSHLRNAILVQFDGEPQGDGGEVSFALHTDGQALEFAVDTLLLVSDVRTRLSAPGESIDPVTAEMELQVDLRTLQAGHGAAPTVPCSSAVMEFDELLLECELNRSAARIAALHGEPEEARAAAASAAESSERLCRQADQAWRDNCVEVLTIVRTLRRRRQARIAAAGLDHDSAAVRAAWIEYRDGIAHWRPIVDALYAAGALGGEYENRLRILYMAAETAAALAAFDRDRGGACRAWEEALEQGKELVIDSHVALGGRFIFNEYRVEGIQDRATARQELAAASGDATRKAAAEQSLVRLLFELTNGSVARCHSSASFHDLVEADYAAAQYVFSRLQLAHNAAK